MTVYTLPFTPKEIEEKLTNMSNMTKTISKAYIEAEELVIEYTNGTKNILGKVVGPAGYAPEKGVDYFTQDDKDEFINSILSQLPYYDGTVVIN